MPARWGAKMQTITTLRFLPLQTKPLRSKTAILPKGEKLHNLHLIERVIAKALREGMGAGRNYHDIFKDAKRPG